MLATAPPFLLGALSYLLEPLEQMSLAHSRGYEEQLSQPLGKKPSAHFLYEIEDTLATALQEDEIVDLVREGYEQGRVRRFRRRHPSFRPKARQRRARSGSAPDRPTAQK